MDKLKRYTVLITAKVAAVWRSLRPAGEVQGDDASLKRLVSDAVTLEQFMTGRGWEIMLEQYAIYREHLLNELAEDIERGKLTTEQVAQRSAMIAGMGRMFVGFQRFLQAAERSSRAITLKEGVTPQRREEVREKLRMSG